MTPTVIRHAMRGADILVVTTYTDCDPRIDSVFQIYTANPDTGRCSLHVSQPYLNEEAAIQAWQLALLGITNPKGD